MIDKVSLVVADVDGTINVKGSQPMPRTVAALDALHERGILFGTASGRPLDHRALDKAREWGLGFEFDVAIGMNGGDVWDRWHEGVEHLMLLEREYVAQICEFMWPLDCNVIVYENAYDHVLVKRRDRKLGESMERNHTVVEDATIQMMSAKDTGKIEIQYEEWAEEEVRAAVRAHASEHWATTMTFPGTVEFMKPGLNKGVGLRRLAERLDIPLAEVVAIGDMDNDVDMISAAGWGVCMANGSELAKAAAKDVTAYPVLEDGFGRYFEEHLLGSPA